MNEFIHLPHFRINDSQILFLDKYVYLDFATKIEIDYPLHKKVLLDEGILIELSEVWKTYELGETKVHALRGLTLKEMISAG